MELPSPAIPNGERFVLVKGTAGLGNRIYAVLSAILYAKLSGRRVAVDWSDGVYASLGTDAFPLLFLSGSVTPLDAVPRAGSTAPWMWARRLHRTARQLRRELGVGILPRCPFVGSLYSVDMADLHHPEQVVVMWSLIPVIAPLRRHLTGEWSDWRRLDEEAILARLLHEHLEVHPEVDARVDDIRRTWPDRPRIGVHVRNTDRKTNLARLYRRLDALVAAEPNAVMFLATDAAGIEDDFRRRYPGVLTTPKWFATDGPLHTLSSQCPDRLEMARASLVEMRVLA